MPMAKLELKSAVPITHWAVTKYIPRGLVSSLFAPGGGSKTRLISNLAVQATRPQNIGTFLGYQVQRGKVLILDADDPSAHGYQTWLNRFFASYPDTDRALIDLRIIRGGLTPADIDELCNELAKEPPIFIILDTFASAFEGLDILKSHLVQAALNALAELANKLNSAVIVLDHVGKLAKGQTVAQKGAYGAGKSFKPRAMFALEQVPPKDVEGRIVFRIDCTKMSYAAHPSPIGFEVVLEDNDQKARIRITDLPGQNTVKAKAQRVIETKLHEAQGGRVARQTLLEAVVNELSITKRYAEELLANYLQFNQMIKAHREEGQQGNPISYSLTVYN